MSTINVPSDEDKLYEVQSFIEGCLSESGASPKALLQLELAVEEIFINIAKYAYHPPGSGDVEVDCSVNEDVMRVKVTFIDEGPEFDPLKREDPDVSADLRDRPIGGLGIFLAKKNVDGISYVRDGDRNVLTIEKRLA